MYAISLLALAGAVAAIPAAVTSAVAPTESTPAGCSTSYSGAFEIAIVNVTKTSSKRAIQKRKDLTITLANGVLTDDEGRTGYIASNNQFQFDKPAQAGAIYTAGWSVCSNGTLALGDSAVFYECLSGTFYNLYDESEGAQCSEIYIDVIPTTASATAKANGVSISSDGQITAASATAAVTQITDGQIQATTGVVAVVSQISDGQIQATTGAVAVVTQISDGQIQVPTSTSKPAVVTQISDGQIQATTGAAATTSASRAVVTQISDGQIQAATNGTSVSTASVTKASVQAFTGAATMPTMRAEFFGLAAGILALAAL